MAQTVILRGVVTACPDGENQGRVEVQIPALEEGHDTLLARVEHSMKGVYWLPEIGDPVEVALSDAPGCEPVVVRACRPAQDPQTRDCWTENNDRKQIRTRSGHTLTLDDTKDKTSIRLQTAGGLQLELEDEPQQIKLAKQGQDQPFLVLNLKEGTIELSAPKAVRLVCGESSLAMKEDGSVTLKAKKGLSVKAADISMEASGSFAAKGRDMKLTGKSSAKLTGQSGLDFSSSGVAKFKVSLMEVK